MSEKKLKIVLVDDHSLHLEGLKLLLNKEKGFHVINTFKDAESFLAFATQQTFDVLLLDLHMPGKDGLAIAEELGKMQHPTKIIMLTMQRGARIKQKVQKLNIKGYLLKNTDVETIISSIKKVMNNEEIFDTSSGTHEEDLQLKSSTIVENKPDTVLSDREKEILILVCNEYSSSQIAEKLFISTGTVDTHRKNILIKLDVSNTVGLVKYALKHNLL